MHTSVADACKSTPVAEYSRLTTLILITSDRYEFKMLPEPPEVLIDPKFENLFMHCTKEHPAIWEDLRHKRDMEVPPS